MSEVQASLNERGRKAAISKLEELGYHIIENDFESFIVALDGETLVFVKPITVIGNMPDKKYKRSRCEAVAARFFLRYSDRPDLIGTPVRFDEFTMQVLSSNTAFARHWINCLGQMTIN